MSNELKKIIENLKISGNMHFLPGAEEQQIVEFEKKHKIKLPKQFREWLLFSDGGECFLPAGIQLYGVAHKPFIDIEDDDKPSEEYIVIGSLATGDPIVYKKDEEQISIYNHEADRIEDDETYSDFFGFVKDLNNILGIGG